MSDLIALARVLRGVASRLEYLSSVAGLDRRAETTVQASPYVNELVKVVHRAWLHERSDLDPDDDIMD